MSRATRHLERLLRALQSDTFESAGEGHDLQSPCVQTATSAPDKPAGAPIDQETPRSSRVSVGHSNSLSESDEITTPSGSDGTKVYQEEAARLVQQLGDSRVQVVTLEAQVMFLKQEKDQQETGDSLYIQRLEAELCRLQDQIEQDMVELTHHQNQVDQEVPGLEKQLRSTMNILHDFNITEQLYLELKAIPEQRRAPKDHILMLAYEKFHKDREEIDELRKSRDTSREALTRANDEVQKLMRELQRVAANHASERRESANDLSATNSRIERLEAENRDALVQIELLTAKGSLYDEVKEKLETLECINIDAENQKVVLSATLQVTIQEKERLQELIKEKDHTLDLLSMDKIYLSREAQAQTEQVKKLEAELERQHGKLRDVKRARTELYSKVLTDNKDSQTATEQRLQAEISRIQQRTNADIEAIRREANAVADEKVRTFREMRDAAMTDTESARAELRDNRAAYDELLLKFRELQRTTELKETQNHGALKMTNFELDRLKAVLEETKAALDQTRLENEALAAKLKIMMEKCNAREAKRPVEELRNELEKPILELKEELRVTRARFEVYEKEKSQTLTTLRTDPLKQYGSKRQLTLHKVVQTEDPPRPDKSSVSPRKTEAVEETNKVEYVAGEEIGEVMLRTQTWPEVEDTIAGALRPRQGPLETFALPWGSSSATLQEQSRKSISIAVRCLELQNAVRSLEKDNIMLKERAIAKEEELLKVAARAQIVQQPHKYLVNAIESSEDKLRESAQENRDLECQLRSITEEKQKVTHRLQTLEEDIRKLLRARGSVEQLQSLLQEKGVVIGDGALKSITVSRKLMVKAKKTSSPRSKVHNYDVQKGRSSTENESQEILQQMIEHGVLPPQCSQHKHCPPHYPKAYTALLSTIARRGESGY